MDAASIKKVLRDLGCDQIKVRPRWVTATCPFARWTHKGGKDSHPSFAVSIHDADLSFFRCQACNLRGPMHGGYNDLLWQILSYGGPRLPHLDGLLAHTNKPSATRLRRRHELHSGKSSYGAGPSELAGIKVPAGVVSQVTMFDEDAVVGKALPEADLEPFLELPDKAWAYLRGPSRGLLDRTVLHHRLGFHPKAKRIVVPMWDCKERLVNMSGRTILSGVKPKWLHAEGFRRDLYLYGEDEVDREWRTCILVEGMFDKMGLWQAGYPNVLAMLGAYISDFQVEKVVRWFDEAIIIRDGDQAGVQGSAKAHAILRSRLRHGCRVVDPPEGVDPDELPPAFLYERVGPPRINLDICG